MNFYNNYQNIDFNIKDLDYNKDKNWKKIKRVKIKKILLTDFINRINHNIDNNMIIQKNRLLLKSLSLNLKYINDDNIIINNNKIYKIIGININEDGLLTINNDLYKDNKIPK